MAYTAWSVVFGEQPSAAKWNILGTNDAHFYSFTGDNLAWQSWTPSWNNLNISGSTVTARYSKIGRVVRFRLAVVLGANVPTGSVTFTLPVTAASHAGTVGFPPIGQATFLDTGTISYPGIVDYNSTTTGILYAQLASGTYTQNNAISGSIPHGWVATDEIHAAGTYESAA